MKYLVGSQMLKLANFRDSDLIELGDYSKAFIVKALPNFIAKNICPGDAFFGRHLFQYSNEFHIGHKEYPYKDFNIFDYKETWISCLKSYIAFLDLNLNKNTTHLPKHLWNALYQYYMIKENTHWISEEAKAEVQKIHDLEMPTSYFEELKALINSL